MTEGVAFSWPPAPQAAAGRLADRGVLALTGPDARVFLQGLITNDVRRVSPSQAIYALLLTAQGKFLHELFLTAQVDAGGDETLLIETEAARAPDLLRRLSMYKLRSKVALTDGSARWAVGVALDGAVGDAAPGAAWTIATPEGPAIAYVDPRHAGLGLRLLLPRPLAESLPDAADAYARRRLELGVPDGSRDLVPEKSIPLENGMDSLSAVAFDKGCYMGQELTARTHYRALIRKRLMRVTAIDGQALPPAGTPVVWGDRDVGEMRSSLGAQGLAVLRIEDVEKPDVALSSGGVPLAVNGPVPAPRP
ncbi:folate-binding protein [Nitrospirillum sp. BR 11163]|uniref:CAF17-like 4Fe-4S cluster assembly/insertion protein YgfZ n=1 Tax=Nitrospirillum sp. BR 11163 TaxID=3104323 RepID=UPI002AFFAF73|nr:folate-binding protein [Nitrospirillum sp. BR 11163]MEA1674228.1 folate-binding protein [Nitrospirillum sp. BR 11163]